MTSIPFKLFLLILTITISQTKTSRLFFAGRLMNDQNIPLPPSKPAPAAKQVTTEFFSQKLDHYDPTNTVRWSQKYYMNDEYFDKTANNVVFLRVGGESSTSTRWLSTGLWAEIGQENGALLFQLEHRFYGESQPFSDLSVDNLKYLTSQQALGDLSTFISAMNAKHELSRDVKWILFGGSYAASLAAWARYKYPHLVHGASASSGPLLAQLDFPEYLQVVVEDLRRHSQGCVDAVTEAFVQLRALLDYPQSTNVTELFRTCTRLEDDLSNVDDVAYFYEYLIDNNFAYAAQYYGISGVDFDSDDLCDLMVDESLGTEVERLAEVNGMVLGEAGCVDYKYENFVGGLKDEAITSSGNMRQWWYQTCSEFAWYQSTNQPEPIFGDVVPLEFFTKMCSDVYGDNFTPTLIENIVNRTNVHYGGRELNLTNVVFTHGSYDPWYPMGVLETKHADSPVLFINGTAHCADMYSSSDSDSSELKAAKNEVKRLISTWLSGKSASALDDEKNSFAKSILDPVRDFSNKIFGKLF